MKTFSKTPAADEISRIIDCPVCENRSFRDYWEIEGASFVLCRKCGLILQNPQPARDALAARYDAEYFAYEVENEESFFNLMMLGLNDSKFFESIVPTLPAKRKILDVGCATGRLLNHFKQEGWDTSGAELCRESVEYGNRKYGVNIKASPMEDSGFGDAEFSVVHASHLIEHVDNPALFADEVARVLIPGGVFICVTPSSDGFQSKIFGSSWRSAIPDHVTLFNKRTLSRLLGNSGLMVERVRTWGGLAVGSAPSWLKKPIDKLAKKWNFGDVVLMVARKPG
jgi:2-polyprenyl-3-methyl-5-hydroxy-6-metoxy-1,4-benzoquinol methylase